MLRLLVDAAKDFVADAMPTYASALAYSVLFAAFPFAIFVLALLGTVDATSLFQWLREQAALVVPGDAMRAVDGALDDLAKPQRALLSAGIVVALWSASGGVRSTMDAMNAAYDVEERRPGWKRVLLSLVYTIALAVLLIASAAAMVLGPPAAEWIAGQVGLGPLVVTLWNWLRWPAVVLMLLAGVSLVYYAAPNVRHRFRLFTPGAVVAVVAWIVASLAFGWYVANFARYNATYGGLGAVVILLLYLFLSSAVLLFGAEVNALAERQRGGKDNEREGDERLRAFPP